MKKLILLCLLCTAAAQTKVPAANVGGIAAPTAAQTAPSPAVASECPSVINPFMWVQDASGSYHAAAGIDGTAYTGMGNGHLVFCRPLFINGPGIVPMPYKNGLLAIFQKNGVGTDFTTNDNRALVGGNTVDTGYVAGANSTLEGIYFEATVNGTAVLGNDLITPLNQSVEAIAGVVGDTHTGQVSGPMVGVRGAAYVSPATANAYINCSLCNIGVVGEAGLATNGKNQTFTSAGVYGFCGFIANDAIPAHYGGCSAIVANVGAPGAGGIGLEIQDNNGLMSGNTNYAIFVRSGHGANVNKSRFQAAAIFDVDVRTALPGAVAPGNTDLAGQITLASGAGSYTFKNTLNAAAPICVVSDLTGASVAIQITSTTLTLTGTGTDIVNYICVARN